MLQAVEVRVDDGLIHAVAGFYLVLSVCSSYVLAVQFNWVVQCVTVQSAAVHFTADYCTLVQSNAVPCTVVQS